MKKVFQGGFNKLGGNAVYKDSFVKKLRRFRLHGDGGQEMSRIAELHESFFLK
jgi:hypothetical protein